jgi:hypothetical protein
MVRHLAEEIERGLCRVHPGLCQTVTRKLAATVAAVLPTQTADTAAWAVVLAGETERADMRLQWIARLLANPLLDCAGVLEPFAGSGTTGQVAIELGRKAVPIKSSGLAREALSDRLEGLNLALPL